MTSVALCADSESLRHPEIIGLDGVNLDAVPWLASFSSGNDMRDYVRRASCVEEAWAVSADDMEAINLAAAMRRDRPDMPIYLAVFSLSGSTLSRARAAGVTGVLSRQAFAHRFAQEKKRRALLAEGGRDSQPTQPLPVQPPMEDRATREAARSSNRKTPAFGQTSSASPGASSASVSPKGGAAPASAPSSDTSPNGEHAGSRPPRRPAPGAGAFVLSVVSGSGGVGKSATSAVAACLAAQRGLRTLLLDGDLQFGDAHALLGKKKEVAIEDVVDVGDVADALPAPEGRPALLCAPRRLELAEVLADKMPALLDALSPHFDVIVVNTGGSWGEHHAMLLERSSCAVFLVDQRASSVRTCLHALELCKRCGIATGSFAFALNRCARGALFTSVDVSCALQGVRVIELWDGESAVEELLGAGMAFELVDQSNEFCRSVDAMLDELLPSQGKKPRRSGKAARQQKGASSKRGSRSRAGRFGGKRGRSEDEDVCNIALQKEANSEGEGFLEGNVRPFFQFGSQAFRGEEAYA